MSILAFLNIGPTEWIIILILALLIFGPSKLPKLARNMGKSINEFKKGVKETPTEDDAKPKELEKKEEPKVIQSSTQEEKTTESN